MSYFVFCCVLFICELYRFNYLGWGRESLFLCYRLLLIFLLVLRIGCIILLWLSLGLPYKYFVFGGYCTFGSKFSFINIFFVTYGQLRHFLLL